MDNPWKSSCSKKTKIYTIIQVSVYDLIWRSQSRFPQKYFCLKLLEHFKFIVHLSFITSLDMSGHFVCIQKNKVDGGWLEDHEIWKKLIIFSQPKKLLEARTMLETFPQKKNSQKTHVAPARRPGPQKETLESSTPNVSAMFVLGSGFFLFLNFWNSSRQGCFLLVSMLSNRQKTWRKLTPKKCEPEEIWTTEISGFCVE